MSELITGEKRQGNTGVWELVLVNAENKVLALSEWGTNYEFHRAQWEALPLIKEQS